MINCKQGNNLFEFVLKQRQEGKTIGFVPTMGALHQGHLALIQAAKDECDLVVCSIFVNPTQFNNPSDLENYPRNLQDDAELLESVDCDILYTPSVADVYPEGQDKFEAPDVGNMLSVLEGEHRPGHFQGVMQVVSLLLDQVNPTHLYMGLKDFQQFAICSKMVELQGRPVAMRGIPIVREKNGLAMSSRNARLSAEGKEEAAIIHEALKLTKENLALKDIEELKTQAIQQISTLKGSRLEYFEIVHQKTLRSSDDKSQLIALCAVWIEGVRLIDNMIL